VSLEEADEEEEKEEESRAGASTRLPKISHAEMQRMSFPE
jgi:hypothetical protein